MLWKMFSDVRELYANTTTSYIPRIAKRLRPIPERSKSDSLGATLSVEYLEECLRKHIRGLRPKHWTTTQNRYECRQFCSHLIISFKTVFSCKTELKFIFFTYI